MISIVWVLCSAKFLLAKILHYCYIIGMLSITKDQAQEKIKMIHVKDAQKQLLGDAKIGRNVVVTYANGVRVNRPQDDQFVNCTFRILGKYSPDRATRYMRRLTGDRTITINTCEYTCDYYQMPLAQFMTFARKPSELDEEIG